MAPVWFPTRIVHVVLIGCISRSRGQKLVFKMQFLKIFLFETKRPRAIRFGIKHYLEFLYQSCSNYAPEVLCKRLHCDLWPFPQVSDQGPFGPSCLWHILLIHKCLLCISSFVSSKLYSMINAIDFSGYILLDRVLRDKRWKAILSVLFKT